MRCYQSPKTFPCACAIGEERTLSMGIVFDALASALVFVVSEFMVEGETPFLGCLYMSSVMLLICKLSVIFQILVC